jgi:hypothetical protein
LYRYSVRRSGSANDRLGDLPHIAGEEELGSFHTERPPPPNATKIGAMKVGLPTDNIGAGATSPLFTPSVRRVLEEIAEVHRDHRQHRER